MFFMFLQPSLLLLWLWFIPLIILKRYNSVLCIKKRLMLFHLMHIHFCAKDDGYEQFSFNFILINIFVVVHKIYAPSNKTLLII